MDEHHPGNRNLVLFQVPLMQRDFSGDKGTGAVYLKKVERKQRWKISVA
jgi:hypothetical protein